MTVERPDSFEYQGQIYALYTLPELPKDPLKKEITSDQPTLNGSGSLRGYTARWGLQQHDKQQALFLLQIEGSYSMGNRPILADWYSGHLAIPVGEQIGYHPQFYTPLFSEECILSFEKGLLIKEKRVQHKTPEQ